MKRRTRRRAGTWSIIAIAVGWSLLCVAAETTLDTAKIEQLTGVKGDMNTQEGVFKVSAPTLIS